MCEYLKMMLFNSATNKILFGPPPPPHKRLGDTNGRSMGTRTSVCLYQHVTWIFPRSILSDSAL